MSEWQTTEAAVVAALAALSGSGTPPLLATVRACTPRDRKLVVAALLRERLPAAYVLIGGREAGDKDYRRAGDPVLSVLYASRSERRDDEARLGGVGVVGVLEIAGVSAASLQQLDLGAQRRLLLVDERAIGGEEGTALWEQRFEVRRRSGRFVPTFAGNALVGASSEVDVYVGESKRASSLFAFPGVDGVFERFVGVRERPIVWRGQLRAASDAQLNAIEEDLERLVREARPDSLNDNWARRFDRCVATWFKRVGPRGHDQLTGEALQGFELGFLQLAQ